MRFVRRFLFLYLDTGNGHAGPARRLKLHMEKHFRFRNSSSDDDAVFIAHGFAPSNRLQKFFYESGYRFSLRFLPAAYSLFYEITKPLCVLRILAFLLARRNSRYLVHLIRRHNITRIVCFHFAVTPAIVAALTRLKKRIPLTIIVTDPFTAHPAWFLYSKYTASPIDYLVFSKQMEKTVREAYGIQCCRSIPFMIDSEFFPKRERSLPVSPLLSKSKMHTACGFNVLIIGGGEGPLCSIKLVQYLIRRTTAAKNAGCSNTDELRIGFTVVCGRNRNLKRKLEKISRKNPRFPLTVYGFVDNMTEIMHASGCIISKAGASSVFEAIAAKKPLIITDYVHGQELGNMQYVVRRGCGWFIRQPQNILKKLCELALIDLEYSRNAICKNTHRPYPETGLTEAAEYLVQSTYTI